MPVPARLTVCGLVFALSAIINVPVRAPTAVGVKVTEITQLAPAASVVGDDGQVDVCPKLPVVEILAIVRGMVWLFLRVTLFPALVVVTIWLGKERVAFDKLTGAVPVPVNCAVCVEFGALSLTVSVPEREPVTMGVKVTEIAQFAPAANVLGERGQVDVCAKFLVVEIPAMVRGTV